MVSIPKDSILGLVFANTVLTDIHLGLDHRFFFSASVFVKSENNVASAFFRFLKFWLVRSHL